MRRPLLAALTIAALAACDAAPTAVQAPEGALKVSTASTSTPVADIDVKHKKPTMFADGTSGLRYWLTGVNSYDPDGGSIVSYYWSTSCYPQPDGHSVEYYVDVRSGETCEVNLYVTDDEGEVGRGTVWLQG